MALSYAVWSAFAGGIRTFGREGEAGWYGLGAPTVGRLLWEQNWAELERTMVFGWARIEAPSEELWSFASPQVSGAMSEPGVGRLSSALRLHLGTLQLWGVESLFGPSQIRMPRGVAPVKAGGSFRRLPLVSPHLRGESVVVGVNASAIKALHEAIRRAGPAQSIGDGGL